ncbi:hypothetical protein ACIRQQ_03210 [Streptomyces fuscichromogenes]|uniref:hypothetical protein n=1 Tax=Streptomyces fuscichromogenes TaxID=1324013 RepID=UPI003827BC0A
MGGSWLPDVPGAGRAPEYRQSGLPARAGAPAQGRLHSPGELPVVSGPDRQECWDRLGTAVRVRLGQKAGTVLEWWAAQDGSGGVSAVVLGTSGLCVADPVAKPDGTRAHRLQTFPLDPGSFTHQSFAGAPAMGGGVRVGGTTGARPGPGPLEPQPPELVLPQGARDLLGNLPEGAQRFLQAPFLGDDRRVYVHWHYEERVELAHSDMWVWCCLTADRTVTVAAGHRRLARGTHPHHATWTVLCRRAAVRRTR